MSYSKQNYTNIKQLSAGGLNKIEDKLYTLDADVEALKSNSTSNTVTSTSDTTTTVVNGKDGITPHIDENTKHWFIDTTDTGVSAEGVNGTTAPTVTGVTVNSVVLAEGETGYNFNFTFAFDSGEPITTNTINLPISSTTNV